DEAAVSAVAFLEDHITGLPLDHVGALRQRVEFLGRKRGQPVDAFEQAHDRVVLDLQPGSAFVLRGDHSLRTEVIPGYVSLVTDRATADRQRGGAARGARRGAALREAPART